MQTENIKEYELIRAEMLNVKDCITKYLGYVFGGAGAAIYGLARMDKSLSGDMTKMGVISLSLSVLITLVLLILVYKFYSHNRFAGYSKLLNHERYNSPNGNNNPLFSWEIAIDRLRCLDTGRLTLPDLLTEVEVLGITNKEIKEKVADRIGKKPKCDRMKYVKGSLLLLRSFIGKMPSSSWGFPPYVITMLFLITMSFMAAGIYFLSSSDNLFIKAINYAVVTVQVIVWCRINGKFYSLMSGSATIESFFWKLLPLRASFLIQNDIVPQYIYTDHME